MTVLFQRRILVKPPSLFSKLKRLRLSRHLTLEELEEKTKVKLNYLKALEEGQLENLPGEVYILSFLRQYCLALDLEPNLYITHLRKELPALLWRNHHPSMHLERSLREPRFYLTPKVMVALLAFVFVFGLIIYIWLGVSNFVSPPPLFVNLPNQSKITESEILITGQTASFASLLINNQPVVLDSDGHFEQKVSLNNGLNTIEVVAKNRINKETKKTIQVLALLRQ